MISDQVLMQAEPQLATRHDTTRHDSDDKSTGRENRGTRHRGRQTGQEEASESTNTTQWSASRRVGLGFHLSSKDADHPVD